MKKLCCPITGVYLPRFIPGVLFGFGFLFVYNYVVHHKLLMDVYAQTPDLWRPMTDMEGFFPLVLGAYFLLSLVVGQIYTRNHEGKGIGEGLRFGFMIGLLIGLLGAMAYLWMPISAGLAQSWFLAGIGEGLGLGIIFSLIYKGGSCCCAGKSSCSTEK